MCLDIAWTCLFVDTNTNFKYVLTKEVKTSSTPFLHLISTSYRQFLLTPPPLIIDYDVYERCAQSLWFRWIWTADLTPSFWTSLPLLGFRRTDKQIPVCVWYTVAERCTECTTLPHVEHQIVWINILHVSSLKGYRELYSILIRGTIIHIHAANVYQLWLMLECRQLYKQFSNLTVCFSNCEKKGGGVYFLFQMICRCDSSLKLYWHLTTKLTTIRLPTFGSCPGDPKETKQNVKYPKRKQVDW